MLVLLGPPFQGTDDEYARLSSVTGLLGYDLKTKLKPNSWGVVRAIADVAEANELGTALRAQGFRVSVVEAQVGADPDRVFVTLRALSFEEDGLILSLSERAMPIPYRALCAIVRGEVQIGTKPRTRPSSTSFRAPTAAEIEVFRESLPVSQFDAYAALDLHFKTVLWVARIDARSFDFSMLPDASGTAQDLDRLADMLAERTRVRVDRAAAPLDRVRRYRAGRFPNAREKAPSASMPTRGWWPKPSAKR